MLTDIDSFKVVSLGLVFVLTLTVLSSKRHNGNLHRMAGPKGWPIIGVGLDVPGNQIKTMQQWAKQFGEIFTVRVGFYNWVVVNSPQAMKEIFDKQSAVTSSKQPLPLGDDVLTQGMRMFTMPYSPKWRAFRTIIHSILSPKMTKTFMPTQEFEVKQFMYDLGHNNAKDRAFYGHVRRLSFSIVMTSTYGRRITYWEGHPDVQASAESSRLLGMLTGSFIEDSIPFLAQLPPFLQPSRKKAEKFAVPVLAAKMRLWNLMKEALARGDAPSCFGAELIQSDYQSKGLSDEDAAWIAGGLVEAGSETTGVTLNNLILRLAANPAAQNRIYDQIMQVVGKDRQPTFDDIDRLTLVRGAVKEMLRLAPIPTWGVKHFADGEVTYKDYVIPKGTVLLANMWHLHMDPEKFPNPEEFRPERYADFSKPSADYAAMSDGDKRDHWTFGVGRRICPGSRLSENTLELALANMLWAYDVRPPVDANGVEQAMDLSDNAFTKTAFRAPMPFAARFVPRGEHEQAMVDQTWERAQADGYELRGRQVTVEGIVK